MELKINLKKEVDDSYKILFTEKTEEVLNYFLNWKRKVLVIFDKNVWEIYWEEFQNLKNVSKFVIQAWEENKTIESVLSICEKAKELNFWRKDLFVAFWGWVVGDIVWFAASIFMRGIDFVQIPTTLVSIFDSSVGWKTWVNFWDLKNLIWTFHQPKLVVVNQSYLKTLDQENLLSGYFEWLKHSILDSENYFEDFLKSFPVENWEFKIEEFSVESIAKNIQVKSSIVEKDEKETWVRKFLNYWHTFWHWIELNSNFAHGICVGFWIIFVNLLWKELWISSENFVQKVNWEILKTLKNFKLANLDFENIYQKMLWDKKNEAWEINFVIWEGFWKFKIEKVSDKKLLEKVFEEFKDLIWA